MTDKDSKSISSATIQNMLKKYEHHVLLNKIDGILNDLGNNIPSSFDDSSPYRILNSESIKEMSESTLIEFGAHSRSHSILSLLSKESRNIEINQSIESVYKFTGKKCKFFAYPNGNKEDYDEDVINILRESGIVASVTSIPGNNNVNSDLMELRRYGIGRNLNINEFKKILIN